MIREIVSFTENCLKKRILSANEAIQWNFFAIET